MGPGDEAFWDSCDALRTAEPRLSHSPLPLPPIPRQDMGMLNPREMHTGNEVCQGTGGDSWGHFAVRCARTQQHPRAPHAFRVSCMDKENKPCEL